jgi:hypothetical protein
MLLWPKGEYCIEYCTRASKVITWTASPQCRHFISHHRLSTYEPYGWLILAACQHEGNNFSQLSEQNRA